MNNLLLGTSKHVLSVWTATGVLQKSQFESIPSKVGWFLCNSNRHRQDSVKDCLWFLELHSRTMAKLDSD